MNDSDKIHWVKVNDIRKSDPENFEFYWGPKSLTSDPISRFKKGTLIRQKMDAIARAIYAYNNMDEDDADMDEDDANNEWGVSSGDHKGMELVISHILSGSYTNEGIEAWWDRTRIQLDGHTPREMLSLDPGRVVDLALETSAQVSI